MSRSSDRYANLDAFRNGTLEDRRWLRDAQVATEWRPGTGEGLSPVEWVNPAAIHALSSRTMACGSAGSPRLAWALLQLGLADFPRPVRSGLLTRIIRFNLNDRIHSGDYPSDSAVSFFAAMLMDLVAASRPLVLEWLEDLSVGNPLAGMDPQPSPVIRGLFLAPSAKLIEVAGFWESALDSPAFPERVFVDPSHARNGVIFSAYLLRTFADFLDRGPQLALERLVPLIRDRAVRKSVWSSDDQGSRCYVKIVPATPEECDQMRRRLVACMTNPERRERAAQLMFPENRPSLLSG